MTYQLRKGDTVLSEHADMGDAWEAMRGRRGLEMWRGDVLLAYTGSIRGVRGTGFRFGSASWTAKHKDVKRWRAA